MRPAAVVLLGPLLVGVTACSEYGTECTLIGGSNYVSVSVPQDLFVPTGSVSIEVCDENACASTTKRLAPSKQPIARDAGASFDQLERSFDPGTVEVRVELRDRAGALVAATMQDTELERYFPNGEECDGDGYVSGSVDLGVEDRVDAPGR